MHFALTQALAAPPDAVAAAYADAAFYEALADAPKLGRPDVLSRERDGDRVHLQVRYRFTGEVNGAVRAVVDPDKLSWVEDSEHDLATRSVTFRMLPDHYPDRLSCSGHYRLDPADGDAGATLRRAEGDVRVHVPLLGGRAERTIVSGLREHLHDEVALVERYLGVRP
ncbi:MAG: DUF2505 family protein [Actinobacteria bacterium]|nr:DUF2505 family protein [Actinomycetota bacterium]